MAHYALLNESNIVVNVITGKDKNEDGIHWELEYAKITGLKCKQTSYNTQGNKHSLGEKPFRGNYAGIGWKYDEALDAFIAPQPGASWKLNSETLVWEPPIPEPEPVAGYRWSWFEPNKEWVKIPR
jgi:hypothetical protein